MITELEQTIESRRTVPAAPAFTFLAALLEDFADEWCTKPMFAGRFHTPQDATFGAAWQTLSSAFIAQTPGARKAVAAFSSRQQSRQELVGCADWGLMEHTIRTVCESIEINLAAGCQFLLGAAPSNADFALFGQMRQWAADPRPARIMHEYPGAWGWTWRMDDLSGYEPQLPIESRFTPGALSLLKLAVGTYIPFMQANYQALQTGTDEVAVTLLSGTTREVQHRQPRFKYQALCWKRLESMYAVLGEDRATIDEWLQQAELQESLFDSARSRL